MTPISGEVSPAFATQAYDIEMRVIMLLTVGTLAGFGQSFDVASVKASARILGKDATTPIAVTPTGLTARNATLKRLIVQAYGVQPFQIAGGPSWLDSNEYDVEAKVSRTATRGDINAMLRSLLSERFLLKIQRQVKDLRGYEMIVNAGGLKLRPVADAVEDVRGFRGNMRQLAEIVSVQLTIPLIADPTRPSVASGPPVPVVDKTGLDETYQFPLDLRPEAGVDMYTLWQRKLHELGLRLENHRGPVEVLVVASAEKVPVAN